MAGPEFEPTIERRPPPEDRRMPTPGPGPGFLVVGLLFVGLLFVLLKELLK